MTDSIPGDTVQSFIIPIDTTVVDSTGGISDTITQIVNTTNAEQVIARIAKFKEEADKLNQDIKGYLALIEAQGQEADSVEIDGSALNDKVQQFQNILDELSEGLKKLSFNYPVIVSNSKDFTDAYKFNVESDKLLAKLKNLAPVKD